MPKSCIAHSSFSFCPQPYCLPAVGLAFFVFLSVVGLAFVKWMKELGLMYSGSWVWHQRLVTFLVVLHGYLCTSLPLLLCSYRRELSSVWVSILFFQQWAVVNSYCWVHWLQPTIKSGSSRVTHFDEEFDSACWWISTQDSRTDQSKCRERRLLKECRRKSLKTFRWGFRHTFTL